MPQNHDKPGAEPRRGKLDTANLRGRRDVSGDTDDEEVTEALIEYDLSGYPRVRTTEDDRKGFLLHCRLGLLRVTQIRISAAHTRGEPPVTLSKTFERLV